MVGIGQKLKQRISMDVVLEDGSVSHETAAVLGQWRQDFSSLLNCENSYIYTPFITHLTRIQVHPSCCLMHIFRY